MSKVVWGVFWAMLFALPIALLFADAGTVLPAGQMAAIYGSALTVLGEPLARVVFCGSWLAIDIALFWRYVIRKKPLPEHTDLHD
jgi:hypothetical protein